jgi:GNAT superfamily N-acetyltransferase
MIRTAILDDLPALRDLAGRANDVRYDLLRVLEEKCFTEGIAGLPVTRVFLRGGAVVGAAVACGKWLRLLMVARDARRQGIGTALLDDAAETRVAAAEPGNYFTPGVPVDQDGALSFFRCRGFRETAETSNLEVDLQVWRASLTTDPFSGVVRATVDQKDRLLAFVERAFGPIWRFEASKAFERELPPAFFVEDGGAIAGFAVHDVNNRGLGFFGPTGVAESSRGRGFGCRLLHASLADLQRLGFRRAVIPWTDALDFYRKCCGATLEKRFVTLRRD